MRSTERNEPEAAPSMIGRVAAILGAFGPRESELGVTEIARRAGLAKSSTSRIVQELVAHQFLERSGTGVRLGLRVFELGESASRPHDLRRVALASMSDLRSAVKRTVHLAVLERREVVYIEILPMRDGPALPSRVGGRMPAHATAVGKALLASSDAFFVDEVIAAGLDRVGPNTVTDADRLRRELAQIRSTGVAYEHGESAAGVTCAAACITGSAGEPIAAISAAGRDSVTELRRVGLAVQTAVRAVSRELGRRPGLRL